MPKGSEITARPKLIYNDSLEDSVTFVDVYLWILIPIPEDLRVFNTIGSYIKPEI